MDNLIFINFGAEELAYMPKQAYAGDAGMDVYAIYDKCLQPHESYAFPLGFGIELEPGYMGLVFPRSSMSRKGIISQLPPIDSGYRGEIHCVLTNTTSKSYNVHKGDRIGQLVILPIWQPNMAQETRGTGAFGSSGK